MIAPVARHRQPARCGRTTPPPAADAAYYPLFLLTRVFTRFIMPALSHRTAPLGFIKRKGATPNEFHDGPVF